MSARKAVTNNADAGAPAATAPLSTTRRLLARAVQVVDAPRLEALLGSSGFPGRAEFAELRPATWLLLMALAGWIVLVGIVALVAVIAIETSTLSAPALGGGASVAADVQARSRGGYEVILRRPLFSRSRQAAAVSEPAPAAPLPPPAQRDQAIGLKGVFISGASAKAFLTSTDNPQGVWVQTDQEIAGWRLVAIEPGQVVLGAREEKLRVPIARTSRK